MKSRSYSLLLVVTFLGFASTDTRAQSTPPAGESAPPTVRAGQRVDEIAVDGRLVEASWQSARLATGFVQREPLEGAPATERTEVRVVFDEHAVYVAARLFDRQPGTIAAQLTRRDDLGASDWFAVGFDPNRDRRTGYMFQVNAANVQRDEYLYEDKESDEAWDAVWASAVRRDSLGWTVELRIPLSQMRYEASAEPQTWGVNFARKLLRTNEESYLYLVSRLQSGVVSQFGALEDVRVTSAARRLELRPYLLSSAFTGPAEAGNPFQDGSSLRSRAGIDLRYGLGTQFTLDATINPDFGQVEADPAVINLTAFETFFDERRPFFVEDARIFDFSLSGRQNRLFYSRRIGRSPSGDAPDQAAHSEVPEAVTILGAAKLTGRTAGGLSVGALAALTQEEHGSAYFEDTGDIRDFRAEPQTRFLVGRIRQDFNDGASTIGAIGTFLHRDLPPDGSFDALTSTALNAGFDWEHQWQDRTWAFFGYIAGSHVRGDSTALIRLQRASNHYFQRPDARRLSLDSTATSMTGIDWRMTLEKRRGTHWTGSIWAAQVTSGFEINDMGFSSRQEVLDGGMRIGYREIRPGRLLRSYNASLSTFHNWTHDVLEDPWSFASWGRSHVAGSVNLRGEAELLSYWQLEGNISMRPERMDRTATRGGPLMLSPRSWETRFNVTSDRRRPVSVRPELAREWSARDGDSNLRASVEVEVRPSSRVQISLEPEWSRSRTGAQHVATTAVLPFAPTFGRRYIFGELERRELTLETRLELAFTRNLSLQFFAQPLLSSGDYTRYKQFLAPETYDFQPFTDGQWITSGRAGRCVGGQTCVDAQGTRWIDFDDDGTLDASFTDRDFNVRSLIGNAVLRWEYRPGSTIFFVWQRTQFQRASVGRFDLRRDLDALLDAPAENRFMVKANWWIGF